MQKEKAFAWLLFLSLVSIDAEYWDTIWSPAYYFRWIFVGLPIKASIFEFICIGLCLTAKRRDKTQLSKYAIRAIQVSFVTVILWITYGMIRGGLFKPLNTQVHCWLTCLLVAVTAARVARTVTDFKRFTRVFVYAALWQSVTAVAVYIKLKDSIPPPAYVTTHSDTVTFTVGLLVLICDAVEGRTKRDLRWLFLCAPLILLAIQLNNRRLAWATVAGGILIIYSMLPSKSKFTRRLNRIVFILVPILTIYVIVGWGRSEGIFKPVGSISTMFSAKATGKLDPSTKARDNENLGMVTMVPYSPFLGTGFGHKWLDIDPTYAVPESIFPMYHYSPHNSVLALLAYCGAFGLAGLWMVISVACFLNASIYRKSNNPAERSVVMVGIIIALAYLNQCYGDMGFAWKTPAIILGIGIAMAARLSVPYEPIRKRELRQ
jgi:hypothetical protein